MPSSGSTPIRALSPQRAAFLCRVAAWLLVCALWLSGEAADTGIILLLVLAILALVRWRFRLPSWTLLADQLACAAAMLSWPAAVFAAALPVFDAAFEGRAWIAVPVVAAAFVLGTVSLASVAALGFAALAGWILFAWNRQAARDRLAADRDRRDRYELEGLQEELLAANVLSARMAERAERARIASDLHDNAGHDIVAAELAFEAFEQMWKDGDPQAAEVLAEARDRLSGGMAALRATVRAMAPDAPIGVDGLETICRRFSHCPVGFRASGPTAEVPAHAWSVLEPCLKEALTNVARHSAAASVEVRLDVGPHIVRLSVLDDGPSVTPSAGSPTVPTAGRGIRNLRYRAKAVGGSVTVDPTRGFRLTCVLPLRAPDEASAGGATP